MRRILTLALLSVGLGAASAQPAPFVGDKAGVLPRVLAPSPAVLWGDYDGDGDPDLFVTGGDPTQHPETVFENGGDNGALTRSLRSPFGRRRAGAINGGAWVDFDRDGHLDLLASSLTGAALSLGTGGGDSLLTYTSTALNAYAGDVRDAIPADYNRDGLPDVLLIRRDGATNHLFSNGVNGLALVGGSAVGIGGNDGTTACWGDADGDGWQDLYVATTAGTRNRFFWNAEGTLVEETTLNITSGDTYSEGCNWADYDGDGDLDLFVANASPVGAVNALYRNEGGTFTPVTTGPLVEDVARTFGSAWGDVDNDGDLDLAVANRGAPDVLYLNGGDGAFTATPFGSADDGWSIGLTLVDDDGDGDLDLYVASGGQDGDASRNRSYRNTTDGAAHWLEVDLQGNASDLNGLGARVTAYVTIGGAPRRLVREVNARSGRMAQDGYRLHFGLGDATTVDSVVVDWPASVRQTVTAVAADQRVTIAEVAAHVETAVTTPMPVRPALRAFSNPASDLVTVVVSGVDDGPVRVEVTDARGRRVGLTEGPSLAGTVRLAWDGGQAAAGRYTLRVVGRPEIAPVAIVVSH